jgi:hypothetical protein
MQKERQRGLNSRISGRKFQRLILACGFSMRSGVGRSLPIIRDLDATRLAQTRCRILTTVFQLKPPNWPAILTRTGGSTIAFQRKVSLCSNSDILRVDVTVASQSPISAARSNQPGFLKRRFLWAPPLCVFAAWNNEQRAGANQQRCLWGVEDQIAPCLKRHHTR